MDAILTTEGIKLPHITLDIEIGDFAEQEGNFLWIIIGKLGHLKAVLVLRGLSCHLVS